MRAVLRWLIVGAACLGAVLVGAYFAILARDPLTRPIDVAGLQSTADAACACSQRKNEGRWTPGKPSSCWKAFEHAVVPLGYANGPSAADGPMTSEYIYVGPRAAEYDFSDPKSQAEPASVILSYPYGECSLVASQRHSRNGTMSDQRK